MAHSICGAAGALASCTYIQRLNVLGGDAPKAFFTLPAWNSIPNAEAAFPYQVRSLTRAGRAVCDLAQGLWN